MQSKTNKMTKCPKRVAISLDQDSLKIFKKNKVQDSKRILHLSAKIYLLPIFPCDFSRISQLRTLKIDFADFGFVHEKTLVKLGNNIRNLQHLSKLKLINLNFGRITDSSMLPFSSCVSTLTLLENVNFSLNNAIKITQQGFEGLTSAFSRLKKLKKLSFSADSLSFNCECLKALEYTIGRLKQLTHLHVSLKKCHSIDDEEIFDFMKTITGLRDLASLCIDIFENSGSTSVGCMHVVNSITEMPKLTKINLVFSNHFADNELLKLTESLEGTKNLTTLKLGLKKSRKIDSSGLNYLKNSLMTLTKLKKLHLDFFWGNGSSLIQISSPLSKFITLTKLSLSFESSSQVNDVGLSHLNKALNKLVNLTNLSISLNCCDDITDLGLGQMSVVISKLSKLTKLQLNLSWSKHITEAGIKQISIAISRVLKLRKLKLNFKGCKDIVDNGLLRLCKALTDMKELRKLYLDFSWCKLLTQEVVEKVKKDIEKLSLDDSDLTFPSFE